MFENESNIVRQDIMTLQRMLYRDEFAANGGDLFKIEWALNTALDHVEFLKRNLPYDHMTDDVEDEVVECDALMEKAEAMVAACKVKYQLENSFYRDHVTPDFAKKGVAVEAPRGRRKMLSDDAQLRVFVVVLLALAVVAGLIFGD